MNSRLLNSKISANPPHLNSSGLVSIQTALPESREWREDDKQLKAVISLRCHDWKCKEISEHGFRLTSHSSYNFTDRKTRIEF